MANQPRNSIILQPRDFLLLRDLFVSRVMTAAHVATLHFDGSREAAKKRLQKLKAAGLVGERTRRVNESSVLFLTGKAFSARGQSQTWTFSAAGAGFKQSDARAAAEERIVKKLTNDTSIALPTIGQ